MFYSKANASSWHSDIVWTIRIIGDADRHRDPEMPTRHNPTAQHFCKLAATRSGSDEARTSVIVENTFRQLETFVVLLLEKTSGIIAIWINILLFRKTPQGLSTSP
jgi:hypothetical protein